MTGTEGRSGTADGAVAAMDGAGSTGTADGEDVAGVDVASLVRGAEDVRGSDVAAGATGAARRMGAVV